MSPAKDLGTRYNCWKCEAKFYDLHKPSPTCPKCGSDPRENPVLRAAPAKASKKVERVVAEEREVEDEEEVEDDDTLLSDDDADDEPVEDEEF